MHGQGAGRAIILVISMRAVIHGLLAGVLALAICRPAGAQQRPGEAQSPPQRPRIGLVLSGGGARGAAHVGVLKVLEELHVPIDAIAGTSMGAVIGGLYASGLSASQIEHQLDSVDWEDAFRDRPQRSLLNFRRKNEDHDFLVQFPLGFRDRSFQLPSGLIQGQKLTQLLRALTLPVSDVGDFDDLPTPFRAVATDLETGAEVVLHDGDLATALRASLSAPGIFAPVERDGRLLVDGGISNNLPVEIMRAMHVDRLIVVDVGYPLSGRNVLGSAASVASQMLAILLRRESDKQLATLGPGDVLIQPAMPGTSSFDFRHLARIMHFGDTAAQASSARLAELAISPAQYAEYVAARQHPQHLPVVRAVRTQQQSAAYATDVDTFFGSLAGSQLDLSALNGRVNRYYGQGLFESVDYQLEPVAGQPEQSDLLFSVRPNSWGPNYVRFGLRLQDDFRGNTSFDAATRLLITDIQGTGTEWVWDGQVGGNPRLGTQLYMPLGPQRRWFVEPAALFQIRAIPQFQDGVQVAELRERSVRFGGSFGRELGQDAEARVGLEREIGHEVVRLGDVANPKPTFTHNEFFTRYSFDSLDNVAFPHSGEAATLEWRRQLSGRRLDRVSDSINMDLRIARSWGRNTVIAWGSLGTLLNDDFVDVRSYFPLGGFLNLSGLDADSLQGPHYSIARLVYYRKVGFGGEGFLNVPFYLGTSLEIGNTWSMRTDMNDLRDAHKDASLFFGMDSFLGPAWLAVGFDNAGRHAFSLSLGRGF